MTKSDGSQPDKEGEVLVTRAFLEAAMCPECDGSGFKVSTGPDPEQEQCQWCFTRHMVLSDAERVAPSAGVASVTVAVGNVLDRWEGVPNDLKDAIRDADSGFEQAMDALEDAQASTPPSATQPLKTHYHRGGLSAEKCPLCRDADRLSWLNLHWEQIEYGGGDLAKLRELIDAAMSASVGPRATDA